MDFEFMETSGEQERMERPGVVEVDPDYRLQQEVKILYELLPMAQWVHVIAAVLLFSILLQYIDQRTLFRWFSFFLFIISLRVIISINYRKAAHLTARTRFWFNLFLIGTALYGVMWSGTAIFLVPSESAVITGFTGLLLCGLAAGAIAISSVNMKVFLVYAVSTLLPYAALLIVSGEFPQVLIGWLMILYFIIIVLMSVQVNRYFYNLIMLELRSRFLEEEVRKENRKREMMEKAILDNTLEEELGEQIRRQAKSLRNEFSNLSQYNLELRGVKESGGWNVKQLVAYKPYLERLTITVVNQINSARDIINNFKKSHLSDEQQKRISIAEKILHDVVKVINKLDIDQDSGLVELERIEIKRINLRQLLIYLAHEIPLLYKSKFLTVKRHVDEDVPKFVLGDRRIIKDMLQKLVLNSYQNSDGGTISINLHKVSEDENELVVLFEVVDTGVGIPPDTLKEFLDASKMDTTDNSGLTGVKRYVQSLGGQVYAESILGVGSKVGFSISLMKESNLLEN
ncbi:MAG: hypothetical protein A3G96_07050 [Gammaproteobacteria bacterium RIFCSPLOWO2_12_FULL_52_10]|nr:MAG: hypothetical protein A3G96_07050 [Gammaproteobacteria bacterium RIFCSPLOWO2_12_FULL_52_10]